MSGFRRARRLRLAGALFLFLVMGHPLLAQRHHLVEPGDTLYALAVRYGTSVEALRKENDISGSMLSVGQMLELPVAGGFRFEAVRAGESFEDIAARLGLRAQSLRLANPQISGPIAAGTALRIPPRDGLSVRLEEGDSLLGLAMRHGVAPSELLDVNALEHLGEASVGDWVLLPVALSASVPDTTLAAVIADGVGGAAVSEPVMTAPRPGSGVPATSPAASSAAAPGWHAQQQEGLLLLAPSLLAQFTPRSSDFIMPLQGRLSSRFGWRNISVAGNRFHGGVDLAVDSGTPVVAAMDGVVARSGWVGAYGYAIYIDHGDGLQTRYAHLSELLVAVGEVVRQGDTIARAGSTGASTGPHLHFEIRVEGQAVDPLSLLR